MCWVGEWCFLHLVLLQGHADGVGIITGRVAQGMLDPPLDPYPGFHLGKIGLAHFVLVLMQMRMTHLDLPPEGWQSFWPWQQMASNVMDGQMKHF